MPQNRRVKNRNTTCKELMFVSQMAFFAHVSDPALGGTLGGTWRLAACGSGSMKFWSGEIRER